MKELQCFIKEVIEEEVRSSDYSSTYKTAQRVHRDQRRRSGEDYFEHPKEVRNIFRKFYPSDKIGQLAALLHDTLEDYEKGGVYKTEEEVIDQISGSITNPVPREKVISIVKSLTHSPSVRYSDYVASLSSTALRVKLADMLHNLQTSPSSKQKQKYKEAIDHLLELHGGSIPDISSDHIDQILDLTA